MGDKRVGIMTHPLGYRQEQVFAYIQIVTLRDGIAPTYRMIGEELGMGNDAVAHTVARLEARGLLKRLPVNHRQKTGWHKPVIVLTP